jgi:pimeloyl-ACP methyl ester carboxylesterase
MAETEPQFLDVGAGAERRRIAYLKEPAARSGKPGLVWLCGLKSEMTSTKAAASADWARAQGLACLRFDYSGHGRSEGRFEAGTVSRWLEETVAAFRALTQGPQILVGSSMGGYLALLLLRRLMEGRPSGVGSRASGPAGGTTSDPRPAIADEAARIKALVLIAPAWDMTELMWQRLPPGARQEIAENGVFLRPSRYGDGPYPITRALIEDGRSHLIAGAPFDPGRPIRIIHGRQDPDVPWAHTRRLVAHLAGGWTRVETVPDGEHRLSRPQDIALLLATVAALADPEAGASADQQLLDGGVPVT